MLDGKRARRFWRRFAERGTYYADRHRQLNTLYLMKDPWGLRTPRQEVRFEETNRILTREFGRVGTLLEIGCGEGLQTRHLQRVCDELYGLDVSARAVARAKKRCPEATLLTGNFMSGARFAKAPELFDVVVACEMLYYIREVALAVQRMTDLGRSCLVTYFDGARERLDKELSFIPFAGREEIRHEERVWSVVWWRNTETSSRSA
jgi:2-polyprenyl-3-methyl-5-hydroxy-6-metoxy-1,4-benzoquinol methylase